MAFLTVNAHAIVYHEKMNNNPVEITIIIQIVFGCDLTPMWKSYDSYGMLTSHFSWESLWLFMIIIVADSFSLPKLPLLISCEIDAINTWSTTDAHKSQSGGSWVGIRRYSRYHVCEMKGFPRHIAFMHLWMIFYPTFLHNAIRYHFSRMS
jgi:hypothetical protein